MMRIMISTIALLLSCWFCLGGCASEPNFPPGLPHGEVRITIFSEQSKPGARFDFESGQVVYEPNAPSVGDIFFDRKFLCGSGSPLNVCVQDTQPQSIGADPSAPSIGYTCPPDTTGNPSRAGIYQSHVLWIKLTDGKYAKIKIKECPLKSDASDFDYIIFEWVYQPDGSTDFRGKPEAEDEKK